MKKSLFLMPLMAALAMSSCSNNEPVNPENFDESYDGRAYMRVRIAMSDGSGTRATAADFVNGTAEEQAIKEIGLKFYNSDGSFYAYGIPVENPEVVPQTQTADSYNVEGKVKDAVIVLQINNNAPKPTYVVAFANCGDDWKQTPEPNINEIEKSMPGYTTTYTEADGSKKVYYAMTSSNYISDTSGTATFDQGYQTIVNPDKFKSTESEAQADGVPVDIYVERLAAKVKVGHDAAMTPAEIINNDYTLNFVIDGYALGATEPESYYIKHIDSRWNPTTLWTDWNNMDMHRCFWAADKNYYETNIVPALDYVSYKEVRSQLTANKDKWLYSTENTQASFGTPAPNDAQAAPRFSSADVNRYLFQEFAYVIGHYEVSKNGELLDGTKNPYLYEYAGKILPHDVMLTYMEQTLGNVVYERTEGVGDAAATYTSKNMVSQLGWLEIGRYENDASLVCLKLKDSVTDADVSKYYIKKQSTTGKNDADYVQIASKADVTALLQQSTIQAYGFKYDANCANTGKGGYLAYFPILIKHLNTEKPRYGEDSRGYYGVVRNHCYNITINKITGLGIGINDTDVDIIPKDKIKPLHLAATINVLSWRVVNQNVDL